MLLSGVGLTFPYRSFSHFVLLISLVFTIDSFSKKEETQKTNASKISSHSTHPTDRKISCTVPVDDKIENVNLCNIAGAMCEAEVSQREKCKTEVANLRKEFANIEERYSKLIRKHDFIVAQYNESCTQPSDSEQGKAKAGTVNCEGNLKQIKELKAEFESLSDSREKMFQRIQVLNKVAGSMTPECETTLLKIQKICSDEKRKNNVGFEILQRRPTKEFLNCFKKKPDWRCDETAPYGTRRFTFISDPKNLHNSRLVVTDTFGVKDSNTSETQLFFFPRKFRAKIIKDKKNNFVATLSNGEILQFNNQTLRIGSGVLKETSEINNTKILKTPEMSYTGNGVLLEVRQGEKETSPTDPEGLVIVRKGTQVCDGKIKVTDLFDGYDFKDKFRNDKTINDFIKSKCGFGFM